MKKVILTLALVFTAGLFSTTALALTSNNNDITVVKGDKDKKDKKKKKSKKSNKDAKSCSSATGEKKSCCSHSAPATEEKK
jgi:hypothetical protein